MTTYPLVLRSDLSNAINSAARRYLHWPPPKWLFHYTREDGFIGITKSRAIRATRASFLPDTEEIHHGISLLQDLASKKKFRLSRRNQRVLDHALTILPSSIEWIFVTCFSEAGDHAYQWRNYGCYCLGFELECDQLHLRPGTFWRPRATLMRAVYDEATKHNAVKALVFDIFRAIDVNCSFDDLDCFGIGRWMAFDIAEVLLDLIVCFKKERYRDEHEWRLVVRPNHELCTTDRVGPDRTFAVLVKSGPKPYVDLVRRYSSTCLELRFRELLPYQTIRISPLEDFEKSKAEAIEVLRRTEAGEVPIMNSALDAGSASPALAARAYQIPEGVEIERRR
jgi:hypothetical protein